MRMRTINVLLVYNSVQISARNGTGTYADISMFSC